MGEAKRFSLKTVKASEESGSAPVWLAMKSLGGIGKILVHPLSNREYEQRQEVVTEKLRRRESLKRGVELPGLLLAEAFARALFGTYVHGWDCIDDAQDQPLAFTEENFVGLCVTGIPDFIGRVPGLLDEIGAFVSTSQDDHRERIKSNLGNS
jgi:hypothetical protein